ncbi:hypothetical protein JRI60_20585 [Archangium violaceum]|uniref:hypothetical protein n=1 Tax=Archangium violaceum TaxID=83451 RepID=UPI00194F9B3B|nr:hypothetical protein [Archangium violaceum]QRO01250.1 hypothetical protein JRI60_20585 [Archangium violaceum]
MPQGPREWMVGDHIFRFEPPDVIWATYHGPLTLEHATRVMGIFQELREFHPLIVVSVMKDAGRLDPEAGRYFSEKIPSEWSLGTIYIGARLLHRALAKGIALAAQLTGHGDGRGAERLLFVSTFEQAHEAIAQLRARRRKA